MPDTFVSPPDIRLPRSRVAETSLARPAAAVVPAPVALPLRLAVVHRTETPRASAGAFAFWLQLHGSAVVTAAEGSFRLQAGDWIAFDRGSLPELHGSRDGLTVVLMLTPDLIGGTLAATDRGLLPGRGVMPARERLAALRLGRECARYQASGDNAGTLRALRSLLQHLQASQDGFAPMIERCPGRSFHRKTRIFARIQKARMYLEGNPQRMLRIEELMELTRFSSWWLSKTFHAVYQETLQRASMRLRMQRARQLLLEGQLSISELAEACGFHDPCSFARQFKASHGETASAWRARQAGPAEGAPIALAAMH